MLLHDLRYEKIKDAVVQMYEECNVHCTPINGFEIATHLGISVCAYSALSSMQRAAAMKLSEDGFHVLKNGRYIIYYNDECSSGRINNTIIHELGHIRLGHVQESELAEAEAKFFAKFALAPPVLIHKLGLQSCYEVMERFEISYKAACIAWSYYTLWQSRHFAYTEQEMKTCRLFGFAV